MDLNTTEAEMSKKIRQSFLLNTLKHYVQNYGEADFLEVYKDFSKNCKVLPFAPTSSATSTATNDLRRILDALCLLCDRIERMDARLAELKAVASCHE